MALSYTISSWSRHLPLHPRALLIPSQDWRLRWKTCKCWHDELLTCRKKCLFGKIGKLWREVLSGVSWLRVFFDGKSGGFPLSMIIRSTVQASGVVAMYRGGSFSMLLLDLSLRKRFNNRYSITSSPLRYLRVTCHCLVVGWSVSSLDSCGLITVHKIYFHIVDKVWWLNHLSYIAFAIIYMLDSTPHRSHGPLSLCDLLTQSSLTFSGLIQLIGPCLSAVNHQSLLDTHICHSRCYDVRKFAVIGQSNNS